MKNLIGQHGDVLFYEANEIPKESKKVEIKGNSFIVERGEGVHTHEIIDIDKELEIYEHEGTLFFRSSKPIKLTHEEHGLRILEPNKIHKKVIEREFDYETMESRQTAD